MINSSNLPNPSRIISHGTLPSHFFSLLQVHKTDFWMCFVQILWSNRRNVTRCHDDSRGRTEGSLRVNRLSNDSTRSLSRIRFKSSQSPFTILLSPSPPLTNPFSSLVDSHLYHRHLSDLSTPSRTSFQSELEMVGSEMAKERNSD